MSRVLLGRVVLLAALATPGAAYAGDPGNGTPHAGGGPTAQGISAASVPAPSGYSVK
jgi:hypothetical protein